MAEDKNIADRVYKATEIESADSIRVKITQSQIELVASKVLNEAGGSVKNWNIEVMKKGMGGGGLFKISGIYQTHISNDWSVVLKILYKENNPQGLTEYDWNREALLYQSGIVNSIPGGFEAAVCYDIDKISADEVWVWMEDLSGYNDNWSLERYGLAAYHLGQMNGFFSQNVLPDEPWLMRSFEKQAVSRDVNIEQYKQFSNHPLVKELIPLEKSKILLEIYDQYGPIIKRLFDKMPQTFGHMDAHRGNLFSRTKADGEISTIGIDWAFVGINPIGTELKNLVYQSIGFFFVEVEDAVKLDRLAFDAYLEGLEDSGWNGNRDDIRYAYLWISMMTFLRYSCMVPPMLADEKKHGFFERVLDRPFEEAHVKNVTFWAFLFELGKEALELNRKMF